MIADLRNIFFLISDCIQLNHPIVLDIRYLFTNTLNYIWTVKRPQGRTRSEWEKLITSEYEGNYSYEYTLEKFIKLLLNCKECRQKVISVLEYERDKMSSLHIDRKEYKKW